MPRKRWTPQEEVTPALLKFREKRKWQIALRRYVLEKNPCPFYAPYFGLDIVKMRMWFEYQFTTDLNWDNFGQKWQFDHIIPITFFDSSLEDELKLCWNFTNLRVEAYQQHKDRGNRLDVLGARNYFKDLHEATHYPICLLLLQKIDKIEIAESVSTQKQKSFIADHRDYLSMIETYSTFEFELLNSGRPIEEVNKEIAFLKSYNK